MKTKVSTASAQHDRIHCAQVLRKAARLWQVLGSETIDGKTFFRNEQEIAIRRRAEELKGDQHAGAKFKRALNELWEAEKDKESYDRQAREFWNITQ